MVYDCQAKELNYLRNKQVSFGTTGMLLSQSKTVDERPRYRIIKFLVLTTHSRSPACRIKFHTLLFCIQIA